MDPKDFLLRHFEKLIAGVFVAWLAFVASGPIIFKPKSLNENEAIQGYIDTIQQHMASFQPKAIPVEDSTKLLGKQLEKTEVQDPGRFDAWLFHRRPNLLFQLVTKKQQVVPKHVPPLEFRSPEKSRGKISLAWKANKDENQYITITLYDVYRKDETSDWKKLEPSVAGDKTEFVDSTVGARQKYWYRIVEHAEVDKSDEKVKEGNVDLDPKEREKSPEDIGPIDTPQDIYLTVDGGEPEDPVNKPGVPGTATFKVWKWYPKISDFVTKQYLNVESAPDQPDPKKPDAGKIGKNETKYSGTSDWTKTKVTDPIDFTTGALLLKVTHDKRKVKIGKTEIEKDVIIAKVKWPWGDEEIIQGVKPDDIVKK